MKPRKPIPRGECRQCWTHAHNPAIHRRLKPRQNCQPCLDHLHNGCPPDQIQQ